MKKLVGLALMAAMGWAQPKFELASVKPAPPGAEGFSMDGGPLPVGPMNQGAHDPGRITWTHIWMQRLVQIAYDLPPDRITEPEWFKGEGTRYDIIATVPKGTSVADFRLMLQALLADRFKLTVHRETKEVSGYALEVAKGGLKISDAIPVDKESKKDEATAPGNALMMVDDSGYPAPRPGNPIYLPGAMFEGSITVNGRIRTTGLHESMAEIADLMSRFSGAPVEDRSGLTGTYSFHLEQVPASSNEPGPGLYDAIQTLGLRLTAKKVPQETLVIDHAEKIPTEN